MGRVEWSLHQSPWKHLLLVQNTNRNGDRVWAMRSESRVAAAKIAREILEFVVGIDPLDQEGQDALRGRWTENLVPIPDKTTADEMWQSVLAQGLAAS